MEPSNRPNIPPDIVEFELTPGDRQSALWLRFSAYLKQRLALLRRQNDGNLTPEQTSRLRGQLAECKSILALGEPKPTVANDVSHGTDNLPE